MQVIKIYNANKGQKLVLEPIQPGVVRMYVCGMTVYDLCHIGHARVMVFFDVVARFLRYSGYSVNYVRNITDVDDKIIARAQENSVDITTLTEKYISEMHQDELSLGNLSPDHEPKASEHIPEMINLIEKLLSKHHAYIGETGDVWFDVKSYADYGHVSGQDIATLMSDVRKDMSKNKKDPLDFCLWKLAKEGEPAWPSPWGHGRPGWHIECSAMASHFLGFSVDIHGGGIDLKFPHHENESAQSSCAFDADYVRSWVHVGHVTDKTEKMSKSLGNFITIRDALKTVRGEAIRYLLLTSHYRQPLPFDTANLQQADKAICRFYRVLTTYPPTKTDKECQYVKDFMAAMQDDFNTVKAFSVCFEMVKAAYKQEDYDLSCIISANLRYVLQIIGFALDQPERYLMGTHSISDSEIKNLIERRKVARSEQDWQLADKIRDDLLLEGVVLEDGPSGTKWRSG